MSYILNALRKSEQERKALKPDSPVTVPLLPEKMDGPRKWTNIILLGVVMNVSMFAYLYLKFDQPVQTVAPPVINAPVVTVEPPLAHQDLPKPAPAVSTLPVLPAAPHTQAISDWWAEEAQTQEEEALKAAFPKPKLPIKKKILAVVAGRETKLPHQKLVEKNTASTDTLPPMPAELLQAPDPLVTPPALVENPDHGSSIPLLRELSGDFQAKVPLTTVNVLAYADLPHDRFVIIDMVKYRIGQRIKAKISLVDILPEAVVMDFEGQRFRLERP